MCKMKKLAKWLGLVVAILLLALLLVRAWYEPLIPFPPLLRNIIDFVSEYYQMESWEGEAIWDMEFLMVFTFAVFTVVLIGIVAKFIFKKLKAPRRLSA